jgi:hypothetical protein
MNFDGEEDDNSRQEVDYSCSNSEDDESISDEDETPVT